MTTIEMLEWLKANGPEEYEGRDPEFPIWFALEWSHGHGKWFAEYKYRDQDYYASDNTVPEWWFADECLEVALSGLVDLVKRRGALANGAAE